MDQYSFGRACKDAEQYQHIAIVIGSTYSQMKTVFPRPKMDRILTRMVESFVEETRPDLIISFCNQGWEILGAEAAQRQRCSLGLITPNLKRESRWNAYTKERLESVRSYADITGFNLVYDSDGDSKAGVYESYVNAIALAAIKSKKSLLILDFGDHRRSIKDKALEGGLDVWNFLPAWEVEKNADHNKSNYTGA